MFSADIRMRMEHASVNGWSPMVTASITPARCTNRRMPRDLCEFFSTRRTPLKERRSAVVPVGGKSGRASRPEHSIGSGFLLIARDKPGAIKENQHIDSTL